MVNVAFFETCVADQQKVMPPSLPLPETSPKTKKKKKKEDWVVVVGWPEGSLAIVCHQKMIVLGIPMEY